MHGSHRRKPYTNPLAVTHEGLIKGASGSVATRQAAIVEEARLMLLTILPDLTIPAGDTKVGSLTYQGFGMTETATADVMLVSWDCILDIDPGVIVPYRFEWEVFDGYFTGDTSGDAYIV
jgi:hypothetical protein